MPSAKRGSRIREVWASNLDHEINRLSELIGDHNHVALDTEFPGVVMRLVANDGAEANYQTIRQNVDVLKLIQLGLTISDADGKTSIPSTTSGGTGELDGEIGRATNDAGEVNSPETWQFNFSFSLSNDMFAQDSIELLQHSGVNFSAHERDGINPDNFADLMTTSGLLCNDAIQWVTFHGGYDFAYLMKALVGQALPRREAEFFRLLRVLFPRRRDLKCLVRQNADDDSAPHLYVNNNSRPRFATITTTAPPTSRTDHASVEMTDNASNGNAIKDLTNLTSNLSVKDESTSTKSAEQQHEEEQAQPLYGGLNRIAEIMGCERVGAKHQAGSDSLLTLDVYLRVRDDILRGDVVDDGRLYGLGGGLGIRTDHDFSNFTSRVPKTTIKAP